MIQSIRHKDLLQYYIEVNGTKLTAQYLFKVNLYFDQFDVEGFTTDLIKPFLFPRL